jgi:hypothetical protein
VKPEEHAEEVLAALKHIGDAGQYRCVPERADAVGATGLTA